MEIAYSRETTVYAVLLKYTSKMDETRMFMKNERGVRHTRAAQFSTPV